MTEIAEHYEDKWLYQEIDRLKAELAEMNELSKKECREHALFALSTGDRINALEAELASSKQGLEEAKLQLARKRATAHESADYEKTISVWKYRAENAEAELARYRAGLEVEGVVPTRITPYALYNQIWEQFQGQRVKVNVTAID